MRAKGRVLILACAGLLIASCSHKAKKSRDVQAAIERMDREHQQQHLKQKEGQSESLTSKEWGRPADGIVARVNEEVIFYSDVDEAVREILQMMGAGSPDSIGPRQLQEAKKAALERLIQKRLLAQEAVRRRISASDKEVEAAIDRYLGQKGVSREQYYIELARSRIPLEQFKDRMRRELIVYKMIQREIAGHIHVSEQQIREYYEARRKDYVKPGRVRIQQIVLFTRGDLPQDKRQKRGQINDIREKILAGDDFGQMARDFSQGPNAEKGGDCGFFEEGELLKELDQAAFSLKEGEVSPVIQTSVGYHLLKVLEVEAGEVKPIEAVEEEIKDRLANELYQKEIQKLVEGLKESAHIDIRM